MMQCMHMSQQHNLVMTTANHVGGCIGNRAARASRKVIIFLHSAQDLIITVVLRAGSPAQERYQLTRVRPVKGHHDGWVLEHRM